DPELTRSKEKVLLRSMEIPSLLHLPSGCTFHPRCPLFERGLCDVQVPDLTWLSDRREVSCHVVVREASNGKLGHARLSLGGVARGLEPEGQESGRENRERV